ncbi:MAG TPA: methionyl-tRNA formyltransferase [Ruminococcaceae bacterium]|nr:methionyl-tRNA formyltransferase [Oscillospiraceae bacterium]
MKIVFMGTPDFAVDCLKSLVENGHDVCLAMSQPDKPQGRKMVLTAPAVKICAQELGIETYQPTTLRDGEATKRLQQIAPDLIVVVAYGKIIPQEILDIPPYGCINVHASLLPELRGAAPIQRSILEGKKVTGVTTMRLDAGMDTGDVLLVKETEILPDETSGELFDRLKGMGAELLVETVKGLQNGSVTPQKQDESKATYAAMLEKNMAPVDWSKSAQQVHDHIRGLDPWPGASTVINEKTVKLSQSHLGHPCGKAAGEVVSAEKQLEVCCGDGCTVLIDTLQAQGKSKLAAPDFLRGFKIEKGTVLGK